MILNFWATWCAPCKREMPSLEKLTNQFPQVKVYAINMEQPNKLKVRDFFRSIGVASLDTYYDPKLKLVKQFKMRGLPTSILIDKNGDEFGRVIGEVDLSLWYISEFDCIDNTSQDESVARKNNDVTMYTPLHLHRCLSAVVN